MSYMLKTQNNSETQATEWYGSKVTEEYVSYCYHILMAYFEPTIC
jgi:hypothetical protein